MTVGYFFFFKRWIQELTRTTDCEVLEFSRAIFYVGGDTMCFCEMESVAARVSRVMRTRCCPDHLNKIMIRSVGTFLILRIYGFLRDTVAIRYCLGQGLHHKEEKIFRKFSRVPVRFVEIRGGRDGRRVSRKEAI